MTDDVRRSRTAFFWVGVIVPLGLLVLAGAVIAVWLPQLPDPIATHWGTDGVDGFASKVAYIPMTLGIGVGVIVFDAVLAIFGHRLPQSSGQPSMMPWSATARFLAAVNLGLAMMIGTLAVAGAGIQRGLADAADAPDIGVWAGLGMALLVVGALVGWFLQPRSPRAAVVEDTPTVATPLAAGERAAWFGTATMGRAGLIVLAAALASVLVMAAVFLAQGEVVGGLIMLATLVVLVVLVGSTVVFRVRVTAEGLRARSLMGWPDTRIALADIVRVAVVQVDPFGEFGGWGWRIGLDGRRGVVMRAGDAVQVTQADGRVFVVTVDRAADAAAVLEALRVRTEGAR